jgi:hypothetical protein
MLVPPNRVQQMLDLRPWQTRFSLGTGEIFAKETERADVHFDPLTSAFFSYKSWMGSLG